MRKPFFRKSHNCWYCKDAARRFVRLDPDKDTAWAMWSHMVQATQLTPNPTYRAIAEAFLAEHKSILKKHRYDLVVRSSWSFIEHAGEVRCNKVTQASVHAWLNAPKPGQKEGTFIRWAPSTKRDAAQAIMQVFRWARNKGYIQANPLSGMKLGESDPRDALVPYDVHKTLVTDCLKRKVSRPFALYLIASRCGARPQQIRDVTREHVSHDGKAWIFREHKTRKHTNKPLVVYLSPCLQTLTKILAARRESHLFLSYDRVPWTKDNVVHRLDRMRKRLKLGEVTAYSYRHTFATDSLLAGNSLATVASLLGHTDTRMVGKVYGHLDQHREHLIDAVAKTVRH